MVLTEENRSTGRKTCPIATSFTTNLTWQYWQAVVPPQSRYDNGSCMNGTQWPISIQERQRPELTPRSTVVFDTLSSPHFPAFYGTRRFTTALTKACHLSLSRARSFQPMAQSISWRPIVISCSHLSLGLPSGLVPSPPLLSREACHTPCPSDNALNSNKSCVHHRYTDLLGKWCNGEVNKGDGIRGCNLLRWGMEKTASEILEEKRQNKRKGVNYNEWQDTNKWQEDWN